MAGGHSIILCDTEYVTVTSSGRGWEPKILLCISDQLRIIVALTTKLHKDEINVIKFLGCP